MAHDVFISYSHKDKSVADAICARLEGDGVRCWYAPRDIAPGSDWAGSIIDAIASAKIMVLIFTDFSNASSQVLREVGVDTGGCNIQFAVNPEDGRMVVIEMNPRVSRSSALASTSSSKSLSASQRLAIFCPCPTTIPRKLSVA